MEEFIGVIELRYQNLDSKSEGLIPYLVVASEDGEGTTYRLYRSGIYVVNDNFFQEYDNVAVSVQGTIEKEIWINVDSIKPLNTEKRDL